MDAFGITEVSKATGLSSRALRHYEQLGLIASRRRPNGYRTYDPETLVRIQRILVMRELGLGLPEIGRVLDQPARTVDALRAHAMQLTAHHEATARQLASLKRTITALEEGKPIMSAEPFDGFDHTHYREEVTERWGANAYASGDKWWRGMSDTERAQWKTHSDQLIADWRAAAAAGADPAGPEGQALAARQAEWLRSIPGTPSGPGQLPQYLRGLGDMYVVDERFAANYGGTEAATFVRDALAIYAATLG